ncbi:hypothetical protein BGZ94_008558 [Podila epigama]|nr:hypothetical protein BGZ94_008558 [Podila epigama]
MDWGMRARARDQIHWDKFWFQLETDRRASDIKLHSDDTNDRDEGNDDDDDDDDNAGDDADDDADDENGHHHGDKGDTASALAPGSEPTLSPGQEQDGSTGKKRVHPKFYSTSCSLPISENSSCKDHNSIENEYATNSTTGIPKVSNEGTVTKDCHFTYPSNNGSSTIKPNGRDGDSSSDGGKYSSAPASDDVDEGYLYFHQALDHFQVQPAPPPKQETFRQYYHVNSEFYKPGGPIILWLPGETPLHSLFLRRGLAYELANATSGLLVALEHRFYGNSIPRYQDSLSNTSRKAKGKGTGKGTGTGTCKGTAKDMEMTKDVEKDKDTEKMEMWRVSRKMHLRSSKTISRLSKDRQKREHTLSAGRVDTVDNSSLGEFRRKVPVRRGKGRVSNSQRTNIIPTAASTETRAHETATVSVESLPIALPTATASTSCQSFPTKSSDPKPTPTPQTTSTKEGLPLDLLKYLSVDQSIEDIAYFIDHFPLLQPAYFAPQPQQMPPGDPLFPNITPTPVINHSQLPNQTTNQTRWILAGCSYSGNLAAWTRQRYPDKIFAVFASSAPVRSALDFYEYSTSQTKILGEQCSNDLSHARDFLDSALQMTDEFMDHMNSRKPSSSKVGNVDDDLDTLTAPATCSAESFQTAPVDTIVNNTISDMPLDSSDGKVQRYSKQERQAAKLEVLSWFSPDFAVDYALEGEEVHAAGWVWWTVASAVQYNTAVGPPSGAANSQPKTTIDILCDTIAQVRSTSQNNNSSLDTTPLPIRHTKALATWFRDQQYFTPTKTEDLQPSDLDPNSVQNLAGIAWLWQTCSELGYLQTALPSSCCCSSALSPVISTSNPPLSSHLVNITESSFMASNFLYRNGTENCNQGEGCTSTGDVSSDALLVESSRLSMFSLPRNLRLKKEDSTLPSPSVVPTSNTCQPCRCYSTDPKKSESVFSRLLTLEAAWQECQLYFSNPKGNSSVTTGLTPDEGSGGGVDDDLSPPPSPFYGQYPKWNRDPVQLPTNAAQCNPLPSLILTPVPQKEQKPPQELSLLKGYPDVETNVNLKFRGWEIAQGADLGGEYRLEDHFEDPVLSLIQSNQPPSSSRRKQQRMDEQSPQRDIMKQKSSGRYYFTNGENDPWKELTLASADAQAYLRAHQQRPILDQEKEDFDAASLSISVVEGVNEKQQKRQRQQIQQQEHLGQDHRRLARKFRHMHPHHFQSPYISKRPISDDDKVHDKDEEEGRKQQQMQKVRDLSVVRIIPGASHCQDILYESSDLDSVALRTERQHVLKTFVRWIEMDIRRETGREVYD